MHLKFSPNHRPHRKAVATAAVAPAVVVRIELEAVRDVRIALVERARPVDAAGTGAVEIAIAARPRSGQEDGVSIRTSHFYALHPILHDPGPGAFVFEFL